MAHLKLTDKFQLFLYHTYDQILKFIKRSVHLEFLIKPHYFFLPTDMHKDFVTFFVKNLQTPLPFLKKTKTTKKN